MTGTMQLRGHLDLLDDDMWRGGDDLWQQTLACPCCGAHRQVEQFGERWSSASSDCGLDGGGASESKLSSWRRWRGLGHRRLDCRSWVLDQNRVRALWYSSFRRGSFPEASPRGLK